MSVEEPNVDQACSVLLIGYGNPGRQDDGLGPALARRLEGLSLAGVDIDIDYQLNIEHAHDLTAYDVVIFADASRPERADGETEQPYYLHRIEAGEPTSFSTHSVSPQAILRIAKDLFQAQPKAYVLGITGYEFDEIAEGLSERAAVNLDIALGFIAGWLNRTGD